MNRMPWNYRLGSRVMADRSDVPRPPPRRALALACALLAASHEPPFTAHVKKVVDGDSLHRLGLRVRMKWGSGCSGSILPKAISRTATARARRSPAWWPDAKSLAQPVDRDELRAHRRARLHRRARRERRPSCCARGRGWVYRRYTDDAKLLALESEAARRIAACGDSKAPRRFLPGLAPRQENDGRGRVLARREAQLLAR